MMKGKGMHAMPGGQMMSDREMATAMAARPMSAPKAKPKTKTRKRPTQAGRK